MGSTFVKHPNRVLSRDVLIGWLKGYERDAFDRSIDVRVTRLRRKIEADPVHPQKWPRLSEQRSPIYK